MMEAMDKTTLIQINEGVPFKTAEGVANDANLDFVVYRTGKTRGINRKAAVLMKSIIESQPFRDGNKRTAFLAAKALLEANGKRMDRVHEYTKDSFALDVVNNRVQLNRMAQWFANHTRSL